MPFLPWIYMEFITELISTQLMTMRLTQNCLHLGEGAKCSSLLECFHPTPAVNTAFPNCTFHDHCANLITIRLVSVTCQWRTYIVVFFHQQSIPNNTFYIPKHFVAIIQGREPASFFGNDDAPSLDTMQRKQIFPKKSSKMHIKKSMMQFSSYRQLR